MAQLLVNNAATTLAAAALAGDATLTVADGSHFPTPTAGDFFLVTLANATPETLWEICKCTSRSGNVLTVTRAQEGTTALGWGIGSKCEARFTANTVITDSNIYALESAASAQPTNQKAINDRRLSSFTFMTAAQRADVQAGTMLLDVTAPLQAAINACGNSGRELHLEQGYYLVTDASPNNYCLQITKPITIRGDGFYAAIVPKSSIGASADTIQVAPDASYWCKLLFENFTLGNPNTGTRYGNRGIAIITTPAGSNAPKPTLRDVTILKSASGYGLEHDNNAANNPNGGMYGALIDQCTIDGGIKLSLSGDSNTIRNCIMTGPNIGVFASLVTGASLLSIEDNNITNDGGGIKIDGGNRPQIIRNNIEQVNPGGSNNAMIDINAGDATVVNGYIAHNHLGAFNGSGITANIRIRNSLGMKVENNTLLPAGAAGYGIDIDTSTGTIVGRHQFGTAAAFSQLVKLGASAAGTIGVKIPLAPYLVNSWVEYDATNYDSPYFIKDENGLVKFGGALKNGTGSAPAFSVACTVPAAYRPSKAVFVGLPNGSNYGSGYMDASGNLTPTKLIDNTNITLSSVSYLASDAGGYVNNT